MKVVTYAITQTSVQPAWYMHQSLGVIMQISHVQIVVQCQEPMLLAIFSIISNEALQETIQPIITIAGNTCVQTQMPTVQSTDDTDKILAQSCIMLTAMGGLVKQSAYTIRL